MTVFQSIDSVLLSIYVLRVHESARAREGRAPYHARRCKKAARRWQVRLNLIRQVHSIRALVNLFRVLVHLFPVLVH